LFDICTARPSKKEDTRVEEKEKTPAIHFIEHKYIQVIFKTIIFLNMAAFIVLLSYSWKDSVRDIIWRIINSFTIFMAFELFIW
jgi:hypothetical protein